MHEPELWRDKHTNYEWAVVAEHSHKRSERRRERERKRKLRNLVIGFGAAIAGLGAVLLVQGVP